MRTRIHSRALTVILVSVLLPLTAVTVFKPSYQTNDDVAMRLLAEGTFVPQGEPTPYLMFINVIIGKLMTLAYGVTGAIPWYDLFLGVSMIAAAGALAFVWLGNGRTSAAIWVAVFAVYFLLPTFVAVQFSLAGMACAAAGLGLLIHAALSDAGLRVRPAIAAAIALFVLGSLIRFEGAVLIGIESVALSAPFLVRIIRRREDRSTLRSLTLAAASMLVLALAGFGANQLAYRQTPGWSDFYRYNLMRSRLGEYLAPERMPSDAQQHLVREVGWSPNDLVLFRNWFFTDPEVYSFTNVQRAERLFYEAAGPPRDDAGPARLRRGRDLAIEFFKETRWAFALMAVFVLAHGARPRLVLYFGGIVIILGLLIAVIGLALKAPPQRVFWPMLILAATMLTIAARLWGRPTTVALQIAALVPALYLAGQTLTALKQESDRRLAAAESAQREVEALRGTGATFFLLHAHAFRYEDFWRPLRAQKVPFDFVAVGASARTPPVVNYLRRTGRLDLPWSLCHDPSALLVAQPALPPMLVTFLKEHRGFDAHFEEVARGERFRAWKCRGS